PGRCTGAPACTRARSLRRAGIRAPRSPGPRCATPRPRAAAASPRRVRSPCPWRRVYRQCGAQSSAGAASRQCADDLRLESPLGFQQGPARPASPNLPQASNDIPPAEILRIENLRFGYDARAILDGVDMQFRKGSVTALMGGSGSGKTTLLRLIGGQVRAQRGRVLFDGADIGALGREKLFAARR